MALECARMTQVQPCFCASRPFAICLPSKRLVSRAAAASAAHSVQDNLNPPTTSYYQATRSTVIRTLLPAWAFAVFTAHTPIAAARSTVVQTLKGKEGERDVTTTASGVKYSEVSAGRGDVPR